MRTDVWTSFLISTAGFPATSRMTSAQDLVPLNERFERADHRALVQRSAQPQCQGHVVAAHSLAASDR